MGTDLSTPTLKRAGEAGGHTQSLGASHCMTRSGAVMEALLRDHLHLLFTCAEPCVGQSPGLGSDPAIAGMGGMGINHPRHWNPHQCLTLFPWVSA